MIQEQQGMLSGVAQGTREGEAFPPPLCPLLRAQLHPITAITIS